MFFNLIIYSIIFGIFYTLLFLIFYKLKIVKIKFVTLFIFTSIMYFILAILFKRYVNLII
jgi:hypothetical protein